MPVKHRSRKNYYVLPVCDLIYPPLHVEVIHDGKLMLISVILFPNPPKYLQSYFATIPNTIMIP